MDNNLREALQQIVNLSEEDKIRLAFDSMKGLAPEITKIVESGKHDGLLEKGGVYKSLWQIQTEGMIVE